MQEIFNYSAPFGNLEIVIDNNALIFLKPTKENETLPISKLAQQIKIQLDKYFRGELRNFDIPIKPKGTDFQKLVWNELLNISYSETKSYSEIAKLIKKPNASRAVGQACNKNPILIIIPCHRVIAKNGNLTGFAYGINFKEKLLNLENK